MTAGVAWSGYFEALERALRSLDEQVLSHRIVSFPHLSVPDAPIPASLENRRVLMLALLHDVTKRAEVRRDALAAELAAAPPRRSSRANGYEAAVGGLLDVVG